MSLNLPPAELEFAGAVFLINYVPQKRRDDVANENRRRTPGNPLGELDIKKFRTAMADELIAGWSGLTRLGALSMGYDGADDLPENADGEVPYTVPSAQKLYRDSQRVLAGGQSGFADAVDDTSLAMCEAEAARRKKAASSSAISPAHTG